MARVLHLWKGGTPDLARATIAQAVAAGDEVTVGTLAGTTLDDLPPGVARRRIPEDLDYDALLELVFASDHVVTW
jgi:hypothetical protein